MRGRRAYVNLTYKRKKVTSTADKKKKTASEMRKYMESFSYTDNATGVLDTAVIRLDNSDRRFMEAWFPHKKDSVTARIVLREGDSRKELNCGMFVIDSLQFDGPPSICTINAVCVPLDSSYRTADRNKVWKKATLKQVASAIAGKYGLGLEFIGNDVNIGTVEQSGEKDADFITDLASDYAYGIKLYGRKIILYDKAEMEKSTPVAKICMRQAISYSWSTDVTGTYTGAKIRYSDDNDKEVSLKVGEGPRWLQIPGSADNIGQARKLAIARLNTENESTTTMDMTLMGDTRIIAMFVVEISGFGKLSGKYFIDSAVHAIDAQNGYTTSLAMHKIQKRVT